MANVGVEELASHGRLERPGRRGSGGATGLYLVRVETVEGSDTTRAVHLK